MKEITRQEAAELLKSYDNVAILMHQSPDGDAVGCAYALCTALRRLGKKAQPFCTDPMPSTYSYLTEGYEEQVFEVEKVVSVDLATENLFGKKLSGYCGKVDLCIDHHGSNSGYAACGIIDASAGACAQIVADIIDCMGVTIDPYIADAIFTGITTDTGCFKFSNAKADSFRMAADMIDKGARSVMINRLVFDTKSRERLEAERLALDSMRFYCDGRIATIRVTKEMLRQSGAEESDTEGIASIPRQIAGVQAGITLREKDEGRYKISLRTTDDVDASAICARFGGGGHKAAAGCSIEGTADEVEKQIVQAASEMIESKT